MAGNVLLDAAYGTLLASHQSSDLNSLTTSSYAFGSGANAVVDNTTALKLWIDVRIKLGSINPTGSPYVTLSTILSMDGTNYEDPQSAAAPTPGTPTWTKGIFVSSSAKVAIIRQVLIPPGKCKLLFGNFTGVTLASSLNAIDYWLSGYQDNG